jgi:hypothetical protein
MFEMAALIRNPAKCEVRSVIRFLNANSALKFLMCYAQEGDEFLDSIVTGDETGFFTTLLNFNDDDEVQKEVMMFQRACSRLL